MKKIYLSLLSIFLFGCMYAQMPTGYGVSNATTTADEEIHEVQVHTLSVNSGCTGANPALWPAANGLPVSVVSQYSNYTGGSNPLPVPVLSPNSTYPWSLKIGYVAGNNFAWSYGYSIFIDYNRNGAFEVPGERVATSNALFTAPTGCNFNSYNGTFTTPATAPLFQVGETLMRVVNAEGLAIPNPTGTYGFGETEDYKIFLGNRKWNYALQKMVSPDTISFCGQDSTYVSVLLACNENQPITGGKIDLYYKLCGSHDTTAKLISKVFSKTMLSGESDSFRLGPILFPTDALYEFKFVSYHPLDSFPADDTMRLPCVQVYKNPVYTLKADTVCFGDSTTVSVSHTLPIFLKWDNEMITDTTKYKLSATKDINVMLTRGWKCTLNPTIKAVIKPLPILTLPNDTVLCLGQKAVLTAKSNMPGGSFNWITTNQPIATIEVNNTVSKYFVVQDSATNKCKSMDSVLVSVVNPPVQTKVFDTVCKGDVANLGLNNNGEFGFIYSWKNRTETSPMIQPTPTINGEKYYVQWWYQGCTDRDTISVKVHNLPTVAINPSPAYICQGFSSTMTASGATNYVWNHTTSLLPAQTVSPTERTGYRVIGTDGNGCKNFANIFVGVHPRTDMRVYSNKKNDNLCLGDSAIIYSNGAKTYIWAHGPTDSVLYFTPTSTVNWNVIGTDGNGCKDTVNYRMTVKPALNFTTQGDTGCEGTTAILKATGGIAYNWGKYGTSSSSDPIPISIGTSKIQVTITSSENCEVITTVPITVIPKPVGQINDAIICQGSKTTLEAKGGVRYLWSTGESTSIITTPDLMATTSYTVTVYGSSTSGNPACESVVNTTVKIIDTNNNYPITIKSPTVDTFKCPSAAMAVTLLATPMGGSWKVDNQFLSETILRPGKYAQGNHKISYVFIEPINGCVVTREKSFVVKCVSGIDDLSADETWSVYPNPFTNKLNVKIYHDRSEDATIHIYDIAGRVVYKDIQQLSNGENVIAFNGIQLPKGIYFIELLTEKVSSTKKIIAE